MEALTKEKIFSLFPPRQADTHKGDYGKAVLVCGSYGMAGAATLAAKGSLLCGAGLTHVVCPDSIYPILATALPEPVFTPIAEDLTPLSRAVRSASAVGIGCGLSRGILPAKMLSKTVEACKVPLVIDADGINLLAENIDLLERCRAPVILTPHAGEMARLCGISVEEVRQDRERTAAEFAKKYGVTVVLKGHRTLVATPDKVYQNPTGNAGMATGGSGDVLCGMTVSLLAQGLKVEDAACAAVYLHGLCGDAAAKVLSQHSLTPSAMLSFLPQIFLEIERGD